MCCARRSCWHDDVHYHSSLPATARSHHGTRPTANSAAFIRETGMIVPLRAGRPVLPLERRAADAQSAGLLSIMFRARRRCRA